MKRNLFWAGLTALSLAALTGLPFLPDVFGGLDQRATLDRPAALQLAQEKALGLNLGPAEARTALQYTNDDTAQAFVELRGGGLDALNREIRTGTYSPSRWTVRRFNEGEIFEASFFFSPSGRFLGWNEKHAETEDLPSLTEEQARVEVGTAAQNSGVVDLAGWKPIEASSVTQVSGRVDWTLVWESPEARLGEGSLRWTAVVAGDQVVRLEPSLKVPESFVRWYENERSVNSGISTVSLVGMGLLFLVAGAAALRLGRSQGVAWKRSWVAGTILGIGASMASFNGLAQMGMTYDTAMSGSVFWATVLVTVFLLAVVLSVVFGFTLAGADALYRRAFPGAFSLGTPGGLGQMEPSALGRRVAGGLLAVPLWLLGVTLFYAFTKGTWGWWTPASGLADPNIVGQFLPWATPLGNAVQASVWEELFFRALPLALGAWAGRRWGRPRLWLLAALVTQALVFAAAHAAYPGLPGWSRLVELVVPALVLGLVVLRWGLVPAIVIHFGYDFVLMSQPLFTTTSPSLVIDRVIVVALGLSLPAAALWNGFFHRPRLTSLPPQEGPAPAPAPAASAAAGPAEPVAVALPPKHPALPWPAVAVLGAFGFAAILFTWLTPAATVTVDRATAEGIARHAAEKEGFVSSSGRTLDITTTFDPGDEDRYVRSAASGAEAARARELGFLPSPQWVFQWSDYQGDVQQRDRWQVFVSRRDGANRVVHLVPEARPGVRPTRDEAVALALAALPGRLGLDAAAVEVKSAVETSLPARSDWNLDFAVKAEAASTWTARVKVTVSGGVVTDAYRTVFVPEDWTRSRQDQTGFIGLVTLTLGLLVWAFIGWGVVRGFRAWSQKRFHTPGFGVVAGLAALGFTLLFANGWSNTAQNFSLAQSWAVQALPLILLVPLLFAVLGLALGLVAGASITPGVRWQPLPLRRFVPGLALGLALAGVQGILVAVAPLGTTPFGNAGFAAMGWSWAGAPLLAVGSLIVWVPALFLWDRAGALADKGRTWQAWVLVLALGVGYHWGVSFDTWQVALVRIGIAAAATAVVWGLMRRDPVSLLTALGTNTALGFAGELVTPSYPGSALGSLAGVVTVGLVVWGLAGWRWNAEGRPRTTSGQNDA